MKKAIGLIIITICVILACNKQKTLPEHYVPVTGEHTNVKFLQMSPDAPSINFYVTGTKSTAVLTATGATVVLGMVFPSLYPATTGYATLPPGSLKIEAKVTDSSITMPGAIISTSTQTFDVNKFYTYVLLDSLNKITTAVAEDDPNVPDTSKAYFRLADFVSNSASVKIEIFKTSTGYPYSKVYPSVAYKSFSTYDTLAAGAGQVYKIYLKNPTTDAKLDSISAFIPIQTKKYTIYCRGVMGLPVSNAKRPIITSYTNF